MLCIVISVSLTSNWVMYGVCMDNQWCDYTMNGIIVKTALTLLSSLNQTYGIFTVYNDTVFFFLEWDNQQVSMTYKVSHLISLSLWIN